MAEPLQCREPNLAIPLGRRPRVGSRLVDLRRLRDGRPVPDVDDDDDDRVDHGAAGRYHLSLRLHLQRQSGSHEIFFFNSSEKGVFERFNLN